MGPFVEEPPPMATDSDISYRQDLSPWRVAWTRGHGCRHVADALGSHVSRALGSNLAERCISDRVDVLVARRLSSFDLVPLVVPHDVDLDRVSSIAAAVSDGPHSEFATAVVARLSSRLAIPGEIVTAYRTAQERGRALSRLEYLGVPHPNLGRRAMQAPTAAALTDTLDEATLLVIGAPGGSWLQRQLLGPGHRLTVAAPGGALVVRSAPRRCFHGMAEGFGGIVGPLMPVREARRLFDQPAVPVAEAGKLVGIVRAAQLEKVVADVPVGDVMEPPVALSATDRLDTATELREQLDGGPVPVIGPAGRLIGTIPARREAGQLVSLAG